MTTIDTYYTILDIKKGASLEEIKKAYRAKAKLLHPDKNKSLDAHAQFILLNEAYEYFLNVKGGFVYDQKKRAYAKQTYKRKRRTYEDWTKEEVEKTRARARQFAKMKYEEYANYVYFNSIESLDIIATHLGFLLAIASLTV
ncbi:MAG TPA: DnaJ domain-containing protein, partial [Bacteroidia bacterium]|nr:DnaJ domain-containing protein [Bacteroidia bacterium]